MRQASFKFSRFSRHAFTLVELLVVVLLITLVMTFTIPALSKIGSGNATKAYYDIAGMMENARTYAIANNTYVFVGLSEKNADASETGPQQSGIGRVFAAAIAPRDGLRGYDPYDSSISTKWNAKYNSNKGLNFVALSKLSTFNNLHLSTAIIPQAKIATSPMFQRPFYPDPNNYYKQIGIDISQTPFNWPLGTALKTEGGTGQIYFEHVVMFDPSGIVHVQSKDSTYKIDQYVELCLQQTRGAVDPKPVPPDKVEIGNHAAISINGLTGAVRVFRP